MSKHRFTHAAAALTATALLLLPATTGCTGGSKGVRENRGPFVVTQISTGQGQIFPYRIRQLDSFGNPTSNILNIDSETRLRDNAAANNPVLPVATFPTVATLPNGAPGNQFLLVRFSHLLDPASILSPLPINQSTNSGLTTAISVVFENQATEVTTTLRGVPFVGGQTFNDLGNNPGNALVSAVTVNGANDLVPADPVFNGFPGIDGTGMPSPFSGDEDLVDPRSFVFVADTDGDLTTFETFDPAVTGNLIRVSISNAVLDSEFDILEQEVCTATTVGMDNVAPNVIGFSAAPVQITPGNGDVGVDPASTILVRFNKPVQPAEVGSFFDSTNLTPSTGGISLSVTAAANTFQVLYYADPVSFGDFCNYIITPSYVLPGESPVDITVDQSNISGLNTVQLGTTVMTQFTTGEGPGIVNAPVAPDVIYVGVGGSEPGVGVIDLNGYGQGTGDINNTNFQVNPNVGAPGLVPNLFPGTSNLDAGSAGALTFTTDTRGNQLLIRSPTVGQIGDIHVGAPLDVVFNNGNINSNARAGLQMTPGSGLNRGNAIAQVPHPNPPKLVFPPPNVARAIFGQEPTVTSSQGPAGQVVTTSPPCLGMPINQLATGNPFAAVQDQAGLFQHQFLGTFVGPQPPPGSPPPATPFCPFSTRQQVGHFLYVLDRENEQVLVVNSNRFTILDTIELPSPFSMSMSPTLSVLAVTNFASSNVTLIDTNPDSPTFNQVIRTISVPEGPTGIAFQPDFEALHVVSTSANTLTVLDTSDYAIIAQETGSLTSPFEVVLTQRYTNTGNNSGVYYGYVLNGNGTVAAYESGPDEVNGIGFETIIGAIQPSFTNPRAILYDYTAAMGGFYLAHNDELGLGVVSRVELVASLFGQVPITQISGGGFIQPPFFREKVWQVTASFGGNDPTSPAGLLLSGNTITDMATDDMFNNGFGFSQITPFNSSRLPPGGTPFQHSAKASVFTIGGAAAIAKVPRLLFIAASDSGTIDVIDLNNGALLRTLNQPNVSVLASYWRQ